MNTAELQAPILDYLQFTKNKGLYIGQVLGKYTIVEKIDKFGQQFKYRAIESETKIQVLIKVIDKISIQNQYGSIRVKEIKKRLVKTESDLMKRIKSDNVVSLIDLYQTKETKTLVCQFFRESLYDYIQKKERIPQKQAFEILKQICNGVYDMHKLGIIHRNLKPQNIMIKNGVFKIDDLSFSRQMPLDSIYASVLGTVSIMAPEIMKKQKYGLNADMWSVGVIFYEMIYGMQPYQPMKSLQMYNQIQKKDIYGNNKQVSQKSVSLLKRLLEIDSSKRMNCSQLKRWLQEQLKEGLQKSKNQKENRENSEKLKLFLQLETQYYLTEYIYSQVVIGLQKEVNQKSRQNIQLLYLVSSRCFINISNIQTELKDLMKNESGIEGNDLATLVLDVDKLYTKIIKLFNFYANLLKKQQDKIFSMVFDRYKKITSKRMFEEKEKFFNGIQKIEFQKREQINFTYEAYISKILPQVSIRLRKILKKYVQINNPASNNFGKQNFQNFINTTIDQQ